MKSKYFSKEFLTELPQDNDQLIVALASEYFKMFNEIKNSDLRVDFLEAFAIIKTIAQIKSLDIETSSIDPVQVDPYAVQILLSNAKNRAESRIRIQNETAFLESKEQEYRSFLDPKLFVYEFSDQEYSKIQELISEIRTEIQKGTLIPAEHKTRLLRRLEAMQAELHKKTSEIDRFWGFIAEAGIVARKFGEDLKPLNERVQELGKIVVGVIMTKEGIHALPEIVKLLKPD